MLDLFIINYICEFSNSDFLKKVKNKINYFFNLKISPSPTLEKYTILRKCQAYFFIIFALIFIIFINVKHIF